MLILFANNIHTHTYNAHNSISNPHCHGTAETKDQGCVCNLSAEACRGIYNTKHHKLQLLYYNGVDTEMSAQQ